ncbi:arginase family protein [Comamonas odontotermitis]|uniref:arginase family protein n=1 Tax=Comamonas odontotermitis TaxID=379895 RepID=UPI0037531A40
MNQATERWTAAVMPTVSVPVAYRVPMGAVEAIVDRVCLIGKLRVADLAERNPCFDQDSHGARAAARLASRMLQA